MEKRLRFSESHWSYLVGFGIPSTAVSFFHPSGLLNLMLFMLVFPICTVLALLAEPQPHSAAIGSQATMLPSTPTADRTKMLSPLLPSRVPFFWPAVKAFRVLARHGAGSPTHASATPARRTTGMPAAPSTPRFSAAQFVGGAWDGRSSPATDSQPAGTGSASMPWNTTAIHIPAADTKLYGAVRRTR